MNSKKSQKEIIINILLKDGRVSRNWCLQNYISRLASLISDLKTESWDFEAKYVTEGNGRNFYYIIKKCPFKKVERFVPVLNRTITTYEK